MTANKVIRNPLWATLIAALVAAMGFYFVFAPGGAAAQGTHSFEPRIIGGTAASTDKYSFIVAILRTPPETSTGIHCGGSLIDRDTVLTAAHCVNEDGSLVQKKELTVVAGRTNLNSNIDQEREVAEIVVHQRFDPQTDEYDAAVLELKKPLSHSKKIKLATTSQNNLEKPGHMATVAGWGSTTERPQCGSGNVQPEYPNSLQQVQVPIVSDSRAVQIFQRCKEADFVPELMIAAGKEHKDSCTGDSGGPLFVARKNGDDHKGSSSSKYTQIGIVSFGPGCGQPGVSAYTEVNNPSIRSFITNAARQ